MLLGSSWRGSACDLTVAGSSVKPARVALGVHIYIYIYAAVFGWIIGRSGRRPVCHSLPSSTPLYKSSHSTLNPRQVQTGDGFAFSMSRLHQCQHPQMIHHPTRAHPFPGCLTVRETSSHGAASAARGSHASGRQEGCWFGAGARESTWCGQWPLSIIEYHRVVMSSVFGRLTVH